MTRAAKAARLVRVAGRAPCAPPAPSSPAPGHKPRREVEIPRIPSAYAPGEAAPAIARLEFECAPTDTFSEEAARVNAVKGPRARED